MRSILLHIRDDDGLDTRVDAAIAIARAFSGHITCLQATPYPHDMVADPFIAAGLPVDFSASMERLRLGLKGRVEAILETAAVPWDWLHCEESAADALVRRSVLTDVIVISLPGHDASAPIWSFTASVTSKALAPVLAVPKVGPTLEITGSALVAWDGSPEASMAMRAALPLLQQAGSVRLIEIDEGRTVAKADQVSAYLSRHDIDAMMIQRMAGTSDAGHAIIEAATKIGATLIVIGAYGHSRLTEYLFGGVTRTMLASSPVSLLLTH